MEHLARMKKYCCPVMYGAIENLLDDEIVISHINFQGDPTWAIVNFEAVGGNLLISFCPWCGKKLPDKPFIDDTV